MIHKYAMSMRNLSSLIFVGMLTCSIAAGQSPLFTVKTNLLFDAVSAINVELEVPIGDRWSVTGEYIFPWWLLKKKENCLQLINGNVEGRYWFDAPSPMTGWFAGIYAGGGLYDLQRGKGLQGEFFNAGLSGGYTHAIFNGNWRLEYSIGLGYLNTNYRKYVPRYGADDRLSLIRQESGNASWWGPTRAKVSLVWVFGSDPTKRKKLEIWKGKLKVRTIDITPIDSPSQKKGGVK